MSRRISIRPPRNSGTIDIGETWANVLSPAIDTVLSTPENKKPQLEFVTLYSAVYKLVCQGSMSALNKKLQESVSQYLNTEYGKMVSEGLFDPENSLGNSILSNMTRFWSEFLNKINVIHDIFLYADRKNVSVEEGPMRTSCYRTFSDIFCVPLIESIISQYMDLFQEYMSDLNLQPNALDEAKQMIQILKPGFNNAMTDVMKDSMILRSKQFYRDMFESISHLSSHEQLKVVDEWVKQEEIRKTYLFQFSSNVTDHLRTDFMNEILPNLISSPDTGLLSWINESNRDAIVLAYELGKDLPSNHIIDLMSDYIMKTQEKINSNSKDSEWVEQTCEALEQFDDLMESTEFKSTVRRNLEHFVSEFPKSGEYLANFIDFAYRKNSSNSDEIPDLGKKFLLIYSCLQDHDDFTRLYHRLLARRLLNNTSRDFALETKLIGYMEDEMRGDVTSNFYKMIEDVEMSKREFQGPQALIPGIISTKVNILSGSMWPKGMMPQSHYNLELPLSLSDAMSKFEELYHEKQPERLLKWSYSLSSVDFKIRTDEKTYMASAPLTIISILNMFEGDESYTVREIADHTHIPAHGELERYLKSLYLVPGSQLLVKSPSGRNVEFSDTFRFNTEFTSPKTRIKIKIVSTKGSDSESLTSNDMYLIDAEKTEKAKAAIVRIMKSAKELTHSQLMARTADALKYSFKATQPIIKRGIQGILDSGFIERVDNDRYVYVE